MGWGKISLVNLWKFFVKYIYRYFIINSRGFWYVFSMIKNYWFSGKDGWIEDNFFGDIWNWWEDNKDGIIIIEMKGYIFLDYESGNEKKRINKKDIFELE